MTKQLSFPSALAVAATLLFASAAPAAAAGPAWQIDSTANTIAAAGQPFSYQLQVTNVGTEAMDGSPVTFTAHLPAGVTALAAGGPAQGFVPSECHGPAGPADPVAGASTVICDASQLANLNERTRRNPVVVVDVPLAASVALTPSFEISGGGGGAASTVDPTRIGPDPAPFGIDGLDGQVNADAAGDPFTQAGGHPYSAGGEIDFNRLTSPNPFLGAAFPVEPVKDVLVDLPPGFIGNPAAAAKCTAVDLANSFGAAALPLCAPASQVGVSTIATSGGTIGFAAVYNMVPPSGVAARFGFSYGGTLVTVDGELRSGGDYGVSVNSRNVTEGLALVGTRLTFWGDPSDPSHRDERACPGERIPWEKGPTCASSAAPTAFLRNPTSCEHEADGLTTTARIDSWKNPGAFDEGTFLSHDPPGYPAAPADWGPPQGPTGCDQVPFEPGITVQPTVNSADTPTGLTVDLTLPQTNEPDAIATSDLKKAIVTLPAGMTVNPSSADGLRGCSQAQIDLHGQNTVPDCPDGSRIGTVSIKTPLLDHEVKGTVYLASQGDNPFHSLLALYIVGEDPESGVVLKLAGQVSAGPDGQLTTTFDNQPQLPFEALHLTLKGGPRAPLRTPPTCGTKTTGAELSPWARPEEAVHLASSFQIASGPNGSACANSDAQRPFAPGFDAGSLNPLGGALSPFVLNLSRPDGSQELAGLTIDTPPGLAAVLKGLPYCPDSALAAAAGRSGEGGGALELAHPSCPPASQVGTVDAAAGAGPLPFHVAGRAYLAGPYKGAPLSIAVVIPALAGPLDLGTVMVRSALHVDPATARITVISDPLPQSLQNIPLDVRGASVSIDRPDFTINPTSCDRMTVGGTLLSAQGALANVSKGYQMLGCSKLPFKPRLSFRLEGKTGRGGHPALRATLKARPGDANIARAQVTLPHSEFLAQNHIRTICTRVQFAADQCPEGSIYGHARAITPLLDQPLEGPVYLRSSNHNLPDLVASLGGQIHIDLDGRIDTFHRGIRNTFEVIPDAPVTKFTLSMPGGAKGLLENSRNLCKSTNRATVLLDGQNGKAYDTEPVVRNSCGGKAHKGHRGGKPGKGGGNRR